MSRKRGPQTPTTIFGAGHLACAFAEGDNTMRTAPLKSILHERVRYASNWRGIKLKSRRAVLCLFSSVYASVRRSQFRRPDLRLFSQVAALANREAVVRVGQGSPENPGCVVRFKSDGSLATKIVVDTFSMPISSREIRSKLMACWYPVPYSDVTSTAWTFAILPCGPSVRMSR